MERQKRAAPAERRSFVMALQHRTVGGRDFGGETVGNQRCTAAAPQVTATTRRPPLLRRARSVPGSQRLVDYQFLGMVAVGLAVVTRGKVLPVLLMTAVVALVMLAYEAGTRRHRRRMDFAGSGPDNSPGPADTELTRWMPVIDRVLRSND